MTDIAQPGGGRTAATTGEPTTPYRYTAALAETIETAWQDR